MFNDIFDMRPWIGQVIERLEGPDAARRYPFRVRVRVFGKMDVLSDSTMEGDSENGCGLPDKDCPLAMCLYPVIFGGTKQSTCPPPALEPGAVVFGFSLDGDLYNELLIIGCIPGADALNDLAGNIGQATASSPAARRIARSRPHGGRIVHGGATQEQILSGLFNANSSRASSGNNSYAISSGTPSINYGITEKFGLSQVEPSTAAQMMLQSDGLLTGIKGTIRPDLKEGLECLAYGDADSDFKPYTGSAVWEAVDKHPALQSFIETLNNNYEFNQCIGINLLATCKAECDNDPLISVFYYYYGIDEGKEVMKEIGFENGIPEGYSYSDIMERITDKVPEFEAYAKTALEPCGGIENLDVTGKAVKIQ